MALFSVCVCFSLGENFSVANWVDPIIMCRKLDPLDGRSEQKKHFTALKLCRSDILQKSPLSKHLDNINP